jgi:hypothetical protein
MFSPEDSYKNDSTFRHVVDILRAELRYFNITPAELRQAAMLAASMHEAQRVRPLFYTKPYFPLMPKPWGGMQVFIDEAKDLPPTMFGAGTESGRIQSAVPNFTTQDIQAGLDKVKCICGYTGTYKALHSQTCKDYNWSVTHTVAPKTVEHRKGKGDRRDVASVGTTEDNFRRHQGDYTKTNRMANTGDRRIAKAEVKPAPVAA